MDANVHHGQAGIGRNFPALLPAQSKARASKQIASTGVLYAHALALEHEAEARYREFATLMADYGNDNTAELFSRLAEFEATHAIELAKRSKGIEIPVIEENAYAWLDCGVPVPEARAFVFRMMTQRMALEIALRAEIQGKAFFERALGESRDASVRKLAAELAHDEELHIEWIAEALAQLPKPLHEELMGDPTSEQQM